MTRKSYEEEDEDLEDAEEEDEEPREAKEPKHLGKSKKSESSTMEIPFDAFNLNAKLNLIYDEIRKTNKKLEEFK